jgi:hypothetical protein
MNAQEKATQQKYIQSNLTGIGAMVEKLVKDRDAHSELMHSLTMHGTQQFSHEYLEREISKHKNNFAVKMAETYKDIESRLENLRKLLASRDEVLDLTNPALNTALVFIQSVGNSPTHEQAAQINENFKYDQPALRAIYSAYGQKDIGGIGKMMYNRDEVIDGLKELANNATVKDGSVNFFASRLAKLAAIEGVELPANPDDRGTMEAMRRGASLIS